MPDNISPQEFGKLTGTVEAIHSTTKRIEKHLTTQNGRIGDTEKQLGRHDERIIDVEQRPSAVKAVIWTGTITGFLIVAVGFLIRYL